MTAITIRHISSEVHNELMAKAARSGRSLQEFLLHQLNSIAARPTVDEMLHEAQQRTDVIGVNIPIEDYVSAKHEDRR